MPKQQELKYLKEQVRKLKQQGSNNSEIARDLNLDITKVIRLLS